MTAVSPLEFVHKKGLFGDHHRKNESDLIKISEIKDLTIFQIVQYKKSQIAKIDIDGIKFTEQSSKVEFNEKTRILWSAPRTWIVSSKKENTNEPIPAVILIKIPKRITSPILREKIVAAKIPPKVNRVIRPSAYNMRAIKNNTIWLYFLKVEKKDRKLRMPPKKEGRILLLIFGTDSLTNRKKGRENNKNQKATKDITEAISNGFPPCKAFGDANNVYIK